MTSKPKAPVGDKLITWAIPNFSEKTKNKFIGMCKMRGINMRVLLKNLLIDWLHAEDQSKGSGA